MNNFFAGAVSFLKKDKKRAVLAALIVLGLVVTLCAAALGTDGADGGGTTLDEYKSRLEGELSELCASVRGVGRCRVTVTFSQGESLQYKGSTVIGSTPPAVMGVTVVCGGGDRDSVRAEICECMCALFDIGSNRVCILKMK